MILRWHRDPAASGGRARAWFEDRDELVVYDSGLWEYRPRGGVATAQGAEPNAAMAKVRVLLVAAAMTVVV